MRRVSHPKTPRTARTLSLRIFAPLLASLAACGSPTPEVTGPPRSPASCPSFSTPTPTPTSEARADEPTSGAREKPVDFKSQIDKVAAELVAKHGPTQESRVRRGLAQVAALWRAEDGDLAAFAGEHFIADEKKLEATFKRLEAVFEQIDGHLNEIGREVRGATELDVGPLLGVDPLFAAYDPYAHVTDDLFQSKVAFVVLLNFAQTTLAERITDGPSYSRRKWAEVRLADRFARRVPAEVRQAVASAAADADLYIAEYNIWMHHIVGEGGARLFPKGLRLISHWNLRDELKSAYADPKGLARQRAIRSIMERIVTQSIPAAVIDNPRVDWDPAANTVASCPAPEVEDAAPSRALALDKAPEPNTRYEKILANFRTERRADPYSPKTPTAILRSFELSREIPEEKVRAMLIKVLESPLVPKVAALIKKRLGRELEPHDIWYSGFRSKGKIPEADLDAATRKRYPTSAAFAKDIPRILQKLGFKKDRAEYLASHIVVDASRGAGHAMQAMRRGDSPHLRTRVEKDGMNYKGYNIAVHELGHNVEQVFSLYDVDSTLLSGVPNSAFTEALAFVFQARDLELLGVAKPDPEQEKLRALSDFWGTYEIGGVALVEMAIWHWLYDHPSATAAELKDAAVVIAKEHWNKYYAPVLGGKDSVLLGIYSHMIATPLYLPDYPLGHMIAFQIEEHVKKSGALGPEFERMAKLGSVMPDVWMTAATGAPVGPDPLLRAAEAALSGL